MRPFQSLHRRQRPLRLALSFHPRLDALEDRLTPDSHLLGNPIVSPIGPGQSFMSYTNSAIDQANDIYLYQFQATAGYWFSAQTETAVGNGVYFPTNLRLFDSTGTEITAQVANNGPSTNVLLDTVIPTTGTYYLGLAGGTNTAYDPTTGAGAAGGVAGNYNLHMSLWQMTGTAGVDRTFTVTGSAVGGNRLEFYPDLTATGAQGPNVTVVYYRQDGPYNAYNPTGVVNYQFNMPLGGSNAVVIANGNQAGYSNIVNALMYQNGALVQYGDFSGAPSDFKVRSSVTVSGSNAVYLYGNAQHDTVYMLNAPENSIFAGTATYADEYAAPDTAQPAQPYLNFAAGFSRVSARRYFFAPIDRAYFYASGAGDSYGADLYEFSVQFGALSSSTYTTVEAFNCDSAILYDQPAPGAAHGRDFGRFATSGASPAPGPAVFYATSAYAYLSGIMGAVPGHNYFDEVVNVAGGNAVGGGNGAFGGPNAGDTAYLVGFVNYGVTNFTNVINL